SRNFFRERCDKCGRERAFGKQIAQEIWETKRHQKCVEIFPGAEESGEDLFANEPENTRAKNGDADNAGRACAYPVRLLRHRRTKNNVCKFTKGKTFGLPLGLGTRQKEPLVNE